jgi:DNA polymerase III alpha subunit (gram-positive type)
MYYLCFDTETDNLPVKNNFENVHLLQIAYKKYDDDFDCIAQYNKYINLRNYDNFVENPVNKISINTLKSGVKIEKVLKLLNIILSKVKLIIAHNITFDFNIILVEAQRYNNTELIEKLINIPKFCTMVNSGIWGCKFLKKPMPKLQDVHNYFYPNSDYITTHEAFDDVEHCWLCFIKLREKWGDIILNINQFKDKNKTFKEISRSEYSFCKWCLRQDNINYSKINNFVNYLKFTKY